MGLISALLSLVLRLALALGTFVLVLGLLVVGLLTVVGLLLWSLLRGRKPRVDWSTMARARTFGAGRGFGQPPRAAARTGADVVDIDAREVPDAPSSAPRLR